MVLEGTIPSQVIQPFGGFTYTSILVHERTVNLGCSNPRTIDMRRESQCSMNPTDVAVGESEKTGNGAFTILILNRLLNRIEGKLVMLFNLLSMHAMELQPSNNEARFTQLTPPIAD
jgi:hypothetical protein